MNSYVETHTVSDETILIGAADGKTLLYKLDRFIPLPVGSRIELMNPTFVGTVVGMRLGQIDHRSEPTLMLLVNLR